MATKVERDAVTGQDYLPEALKDHRYYSPVGRGYEKHIVEAQRLREQEKEKKK